MVAWVVPTILLPIAVAVLSAQLSPATALHTDSVTEFNIYVDDDDVVFGQWQATAGTTEMQEISTLRGVETSWFRIEGVMDPGDYLGILEVTCRIRDFSITVAFFSLEQCIYIA